jgi:hypothetical protein
MGEAMRPSLWPWRTVAALLLGVLFAAGAEPRVRPLPRAALTAAETLYREGVLPDGSPLRGERKGSEPVEGQAAACANCHRRSGFGVEEGRIVIPPINGKYLFREGTIEAAAMAHPGSEALTPRRSRYTSETLARAIREGTDPDGRKLDYLMPRFALDDPTMTLLISYLRELSTHPAPGAITDVLQFATVVTPDADPKKRDAMLDVLNHFFGNKNAFYRGADPPLESERRIHFRVLRRWQLHVWELQGAPETWEAQLEQDFKADPVFAVLSGVGGRTWAPVHEFCERHEIPCLMPNVDLPVVDEKAFYPVYFSRGVLLEADVMARRLSTPPPDSSPSARGTDPGGVGPPPPEPDTQRPIPRRIVEIFRPDDIGAPAARALAAALAPSGAQAMLRELKAKSPARELATLLREAKDADALVLWLRPADLGALPERAAFPGPVLVSGLMGGLERAPLPASWRSTARLSYPFALPAQRIIAMDYPLGWFKIQNIAVNDERTQTDTYLACSILAEAASTMLDNFVPDYLIERVEVELSHRIINGYYPRLGLAPGQRFASKGAYFVRLIEPAGTRVVADGDWLVP